MNTTLLIIDAQNDFCLPNAPLEVKGAMADMQNIANFIKRKQIDTIIDTFDDHRRKDIAHPLYWADGVPLFTPITLAEVKEGKYKVRNQKDFEWTIYYLAKLEAQKNYPHIVWPYHCIAGTKGAAMVDVVADAIAEWEFATGETNIVIRKGNNPYVEHYSAVKAEVVYAFNGDYDQDTNVNYKLITELKYADTIYVGGEALSHCVANTVRDLVKYGVNPNNVTILTDCTSNVGNFEFLGDAFRKEMEDKGMKFAKSTDI